MCNLQDILNETSKEELEEAFSDEEIGDSDDIESTVADSNTDAIQINHDVVLTMEEN